FLLDYSVVNSCSGQNGSPLRDCQTIAHLKMPQGANDSSSTLKEVLLHAVGKRRHRVVEKPGKCNGSIKDKTIQARPSSISSFTSTLRVSLTRFRILSIS